MVGLAVVWVEGVGNTRAGVVTGITVGSVPHPAQRGLGHCRGCELWRSSVGSTSKFPAEGGVYRERMNSQNQTLSSELLSDEML